MNAQTLAPFCVAVPLAVAALLVPFKATPRLPRDLAVLATSAAVAAATVVVLLSARARPFDVWFGGWRPHRGIALGISFHVDGIGATFGALAALLVFAALLFAWKYFRESGPFFAVLMLVFLAAMVGFSYSGDIFNMFVFFELMSVTAYALTAYRIEEAKSIAGAINFAMTNSVGAFLVLFGIALLYGRTGALNLAQIHAALARGPVDGLVVAAFALLATGFFVKGAIVPFHLWLDDAHAVAPTPLCILFSGVMVQLGLYAVARVSFTCFGDLVSAHATGIRDLFLTLGILTALLGGVMAFLQSHTKRLLAFSTVSHSGMFLCGLALLSPLGIAAMTLFVVAHGLIKGSLFMGSGIMLHREHSVDERRLFGKGRELPFVGVVFVLGAIALADVPPFGTQAGKSLLDLALEHASVGWVIPALALASAIDSAAVFRIAGRIFVGMGDAPAPVSEPASDDHHETSDTGGKTPWSMIAAPVLLLAIAVLMGRYDLASPALHAADAFTSFGHTALPPQTGKEMLVTAATAVLALLLALAALYPRKIPAALRSLERATRPAVGILRGFHSGIFTDYVSWIVAGVAFCGVWLVIARP